MEYLVSEEELIYSIIWLYSIINGLSEFLLFWLKVWFNEFTFLIKFDGKLLKEMELIFLLTCAWGCSKTKCSWFVSQFDKKRDNPKRTIQILIKLFSLLFISDKFNVNNLFLNSICCNFYRNVSSIWTTTVWLCVVRD